MPASYTLTTAEKSLTFIFQINGYNLAKIKKN